MNHDFRNIVAQDSVYSTATPVLMAGEELYEH